MSDFGYYEIRSDSGFVADGETGRLGEGGREPGGRVQAKTKLHWDLGMLGARRCASVLPCRGTLLASRRFPQVSSQPSLARRSTHTAQWANGSALAEENKFQGPGSLPPITARSRP